MVMNMPPEVGFGVITVGTRRHVPNMPRFRATGKTIHTGNDLTGAVGGRNPANCGSMPQNRPAHSVLFLERERHENFLHEGDARQAIANCSVY